MTTVLYMSFYHLYLEQSTMLCEGAICLKVQYVCVSSRGAEMYCLLGMYPIFLCSCYGQLRFSLYSGAVITRTQFLVTIPLLMIVPSS